MNFKIFPTVILCAFVSACSLDQPEQPQPAPDSTKTETPAPAPPPAAPAPPPAPSPAPSPAPLAETTTTSPKPEAVPFFNEQMQLQQNNQPPMILEAEVAEDKNSNSAAQTQTQAATETTPSLIVDLQNGAFDSKAPIRTGVVKPVDLPPLGQRFWMAASTSTTQGERAFFQRLMDDPEAWNEKDEIGRGLIHILAEKGMHRILKLIHDIELDRSFSHTDKLGRYPAHYASNRETIKLIWENTKVKASGGRHYLSPATTLKDSEGKLPLHVLIEQRKTKAALFVIDKLCSLSFSAMFYGSGVNSTDLLNRTPLHYAAITNNAAIADALVRCSFTDKNTTDSSLRTPLHYAAQFPDFAAGYDLTRGTQRTSSGADVRDRDGRTPLDIAVQTHNEIGTAILSRPGIPF